MTTEGKKSAVCLRVALLLDHVGESSPPDCFLPQTSLLSPCSNPKQKREAMPKHHFSFWRRVRDFFGILPYAFASLCSLTTSAKTVHRTVFFRRQVCSLLVQIPNKKEKQCQSITSLFGGELGIFSAYCRMPSRRFAP